MVKKHLKLLRLTISFGIIAGTFGSIQFRTIAEEKKNSVILQPNPTYKQTSSNQFVYNFHSPNSQLLTANLTVSDSFENPFPKKKTNQQTLNENNQKYSMSQLNQLSYQQLVDLLVTIQWNDIKDLFEFNNNSLVFYQDQNRVQFIIDAIATQGKLYTNNDSKGLETLIEVLRSGFYLGFYHSELQYLNERSFHDRCLPALNIIAENPNFQLGTPEQDKVVSSYGRLIGNASSNVKTVQDATAILKQYNDHLGTYMEEYSKRDAVYALVHGIGYDLQTYLNTTHQQSNQTPWYGNIDGFVEETGTLALSEHITRDTGWLINNAIYYVGQIGVFHSTPSKGLQILTQVLELYPYLSEQYLTAAQQISDNYDGKDYNGNTIDYKKILEDGKNKYLPKTYTFDNGSMVVKAGDKVTEDKIKRLYWASKEVQAQFFRLVGNNQPLDKGNADNVLTMVIYNSPEDYQLNHLLYGYDTNNGGIYIEGIGTFFTYERTPQESVFSLEELFRHEFTHYLQGRYEVPGLFGQGDMYQDERLTWFEEGNAEFFAGSTRTNGVVPRKSIIDRLSIDPTQRYTVAQTLYARYGTWDFYNYSFALQSYMYNEHFDFFDKLDNLIRSNNVAEYDAYRETLSKDPTLNEQYQAYMQKLIDNKDQYSTPAVSNDYLLPHKRKALNEVSREIVNVAKLKDIKINELHSQFFNTFTIQGTYVAGKSKGKDNDWKKMNKILDTEIELLSSKSWGGYKTVTAYFINYRTNSNNQVEYDVVFQGIDTSIKK
ncbi:hypothetical protein IIU_06092 [Bacillus cereus VD133]|uniref:microbial collagenase n=1 Tax=Bacillus cereus VD133 TaxID=1053233 RepID=A0A9W5PKV1_BACCE|nr:collagenase [Bacillus cereus]EOO25724.1 hypothetical protein IIU_06092 [Bacillus cereus VD133]